MVNKSTMPPLTKREQAMIQVELLEEQTPQGASQIEPGLEDSGSGWEQLRELALAERSDTEMFRGD